MKINEKGLNIIKTCEGCRLETYKDIIGINTIGFGHTGPEVKPGLVWTQEQADNQLRQDLVKFEDGVSDQLDVDVNENQFSALVSLAYNIGQGNFNSSGLLRQVNEGNFEEAAKRFSFWNKAGGKVSEGLTKRRAMEAALFMESV